MTSEGVEEVPSRRPATPGTCPPGLCSGPWGPARAPRAAHLAAGKRSYPSPEMKPPRFSLSDSGLVSAPPRWHAAPVYSAEINIRCL